MLFSSPLEFISKGSREYEIHTYIQDQKWIVLELEPFEIGHIDLGHPVSFWKSYLLVKDVVWKYQFLLLRMQSILSSNETAAEMKLSRQISNESKQKQIVR